MLYSKNNKQIFTYKNTVFIFWVFCYLFPLCLQCFVILDINCTNTKIGAQRAKNQKKQYISMVFSEGEEFGVMIKKMKWVPGLNSFLKLLPHEDLGTN